VLMCGFAEKASCLLVVIPLLVFDCVALRSNVGISGLFSREYGYVFFIRAGQFWIISGFSGHPLFPKERCFEGTLQRFCLLSKPIRCVNSGYLANHKLN
jgi:hypothetical protein